MPEHLRVVNWKHRDKTKIEKDKNENVKFWRGLNRVYMDQQVAMDRIRELEGFLNDRYVTYALPFLELHYTSNNKPKEAAEVNKLFNKIIKSLGNET